MLGIRVKHTRADRQLALSQEIYVKDMLRRYAPHLATAMRRFDSPMAEDVQYSPEQCPAAGSQEARGHGASQGDLHVCGRRPAMASSLHQARSDVYDVGAGAFCFEPSANSLCGDAARPCLLADDAGRESCAATWLEAEWC